MCTLQLIKTPPRQYEIRRLLYFALLSTLLGITSTDGAYEPQPTLVFNITVAGSDTRPTENRRRLLRCRVVESNRRLAVHWRRYSATGQWTTVSGEGDYGYGEEGNAETLRCAAKLDDGAVQLSGSPRLSSGRPPELELSRRSLSVPAGWPAQFRCRVAVGVGEAAEHVTWSKDGRVLVEHETAGVEILVSGTLLHIVKVAESHVGDYLCSASNTHGTKMAVAHLSLVAGTNRPPSAAASQPQPTSGTQPDSSSIEELAVTQETDARPQLVVRPADDAVRVGHSALFECVADESVCQATVWKKLKEKGQPDIWSAFVSGRAQLIRGNLLITNVSALDQGNYACICHSGSRAFQYEVRLNVIEKLNLKMELSLRTPIQAMRNPAIDCRILAGGYPPPAVKWFHNGEPIKSVGRTKISAPTRLEVLAVLPEDGGIYQCMASNELGEVAGTVRMPVSRPELAPLTEFRAVADHAEQTIVFSWNKPNISDDSFFAYYILSGYETEVGHVKTRFLHAGKDRPNCRGKLSCVTILRKSNGDIELLPRRNYTFYISWTSMSRSKNRGTMAPRSKNIMVETFDGYSKLGVPIALTALRGGSARVHLSALSAEQKNGVVEQNLVQYGLADEKPLYNYYWPEAITERNVENLEAGREYRIRVLPKTRAGLPPANRLNEPDYSYSVYGVPKEPAESALLGAPQKFHGETLNSSAVAIYWSASSNDFPLIGAVRLSYSPLPMEGCSRMRKADFAKETNAYVLTGLQAETEYRICVAFVDENGKLGPQPSLRLLTGKGDDGSSADVATPTKIRCELSDIGRWIMEWEKPKLVGNAVLDGYVVRFSSQFNNSQFEPFTLDSKSERLLLDDVAKGRYNIAVRAYALAPQTVIEGDFSTEHICDKTLSAAQRQPSEVEAHCRSHSLHISWKRPVELPSKYVVKYIVGEPSSPKSWESAPSVTLPSATVNHRMADVKNNNTVYSVHIYAIFTDNSEASTTVVVHCRSSDVGLLPWEAKRHRMILVSVAALVIVVAVLVVVLLVWCCCRTLRCRLCCGNSEANSRRCRPKGDQKRYHYNGGGLARNENGGRRNDLTANGRLCSSSSSPNTNDNTQWLKLDSLTPANGRPVMAEEALLLDTKGGESGPRPSGCSTNYSPSELDKLHPTLLMNDAVVTIEDQQLSGEPSPYTLPQLVWLNLDDRSKVSGSYKNGGGGDTSGRHQMAEISSDLSQSPATASSLHSWCPTAEEGAGRGAGLVCSMPNLLSDSGILADQAPPANSSLVAVEQSQRDCKTNANGRTPARNGTVVREAAALC